MRVAVKVYDKAALSPSKLRAVKREAAMMIMMQRKRRAPRLTAAHGACFNSVGTGQLRTLCQQGKLGETTLVC